MAITITAIIFLGIVIYFYYRNKKKPIALSRQEQLQKKSSSNLEEIQSSKRYWGAYIDYKNDTLCCAAVLKLQKKQYPKKLVPDIPLAGCDRPLCRCHYVAIIERREKTRRLNESRREEIRFEDNPDRRSKLERRSSMWQNHED